jgi:hypothetical protein
LAALQPTFSSKEPSSSPQNSDQSILSRNRVYDRSRARLTFWQAEQFGDVNGDVKRLSPKH